MDVERTRHQFPGLARTVGGSPAAFLDGPAGSQVPRRVADAVGRYLVENNANTGGFFPTSTETADLHSVRPTVRLRTSWAPGTPIASSSAPT